MASNFLKICTVGLLVGGAAGLLTGCGFTPMYGKSDAQRAVVPQLSLIEIGAIANEPGQQLRNQLIDRLYPRGRAAGLLPRYMLGVSLTESKQGIAISSDATVTRQQLVNSVDFSLLDNNTHTLLLQRHLFVTSGYNVLGSQFSTLIAEQDARGRNLADLADRITLSLSLYFSNPAGTRAAPPVDAVPMPVFRNDPGGLTSSSNAAGFTNSGASSF